MLIDEDDADESSSRRPSPLKYWKIEALLVAFECAERLPHRRLKDAFKMGLRLFLIYRCNEDVDTKIYCLSEILIVE